MKFGPKLAVWFVVLAVLPLGAASVVYLTSTAEFGREMAQQGKGLLTQRLIQNLRRATEGGAIALAQTARDLRGDAAFIAGDVAARLASSEPTAERAWDDQTFTLLDADKTTSDLDRVGVRIAADAARDGLSGMLSKLTGINEVTRTVYARNAPLIRDIAIVLEDGATLSYPIGLSDDDFLRDPREQNWYLETMLSGESALFTEVASAPPGVSIVVAPITFADDRRAGVVRLSVHLRDALATALDSTRMPPEATAYLISIPDDAPQLLPHEVATLKPGATAWTPAAAPTPFFLDGDDGWLKVVSDLRTGVPGVEFVTRLGVPEVWAFGPVGRAADSAWNIATVFPQAIIDEAQATAEKTVEDAYKIQARNAIAFSLLAALLAAGLGLFAARTMTRPILQLHQAAEKLAAGDFSVRVDNPSADELGDLGRDFNNMVPSLEEQIRVRRELDAAREIQQHLIPDSAPTITGFDLAGETVYCDETGGDYQDYIPLGTNGTRGLGIAIGDITGHGLGAALLMASARAALRAVAGHVSDPASMMNAVNERLAEDAGGGRFLTLLYLHIHPSKSEITWISAGHEPALIYDPKSDSFSQLEGEGIPLGVDADWAYGADTTKIPEDGMLVAVTDGVRETVNSNGEQYGLQRLKAAIRAAHGHGSATVCENILADIKAFQGDAKTRDDVSILVLRATT